MAKGLASRTLAGALLALCWGSGCERQPPPAPQAVPVTVAPVLVRDQVVYSEYVGLTRGSTEVEVRARVEGILEAVHFQEGTLVTAGDLLYTIDPRPYEANLNQAQAELARLQSVAAKARQDLARFEPLIQRNAISRQQYDEAVAAVRSTTAAVQAAEAAVAAAELQLEYTRVRAPVDGLIGKSEVQQGNLVGRGQNTLLTTISTIDPIHVRFSVSERAYLDWRRQYPDERQSRQATSNRFELVLADGTHYPFKGSVVFADRTVDPTTGTLLIEVGFPNPEKLIRPGQYVRVLFPSTVITNAILVPQRAVQELLGTYSVMVVTPDHRAESRPVRPGERVGSLWIIEQGLKPDDNVIVAGHQRLQPGVPVQPTWTEIEEPTESGVPSPTGPGSGAPGPPPAGGPNPK